MRRLGGDSFMLAFYFFSVFVLLLIALSWIVHDILLSVLIVPYLLFFFVSGPLKY